MPYEIAGPTRQCAATGRTLHAGEVYFAVLRQVEGEWVRVDYAGDAWHGPPPGAFGYWKGRVPAELAKMQAEVDPVRLLELFEQGCEAVPGPGEGLHFVVALYLLRKRLLKLIEVRQDDAGACWVLQNNRNARRYEVRDPQLSGEQLASCEEQLHQLLTAS